MFCMFTYICWLHLKGFNYTLVGVREDELSKVLNKEKEDKKTEDRKTEDRKTEDRKTEDRKTKTEKYSRSPGNVRPSLRGLIFCTLSTTQTQRRKEITADTLEVMSLKMLKVRARLLASIYHVMLHRCSRK